VNAGHDLDQVNLKEFLLKVEVDEVSIGQALISDALEEGLEATVHNYLKICK
jgi:pyridoxine 5-phosphate synthase